MYWVNFWMAVNLFAGINWVVNAQFGRESLAGTLFKSVWVVMTLQNFALHPDVDQPLRWRYILDKTGTGKNCLMHFHGEAICI